MSTLTKSDMIEHLMNELNLTRQEGRCLVENFFDASVILSSRIKTVAQVVTQKQGNLLLFPRAVLLLLKQVRNFVKKLTNVYLKLSSIDQMGLINKARSLS